MEEQHFYELLREAVMHLLGDEYEITRKQVTKNNNVKMEALLIREDGVNVMPTIYVNEYYRQYMNGVTLEELASRVKETYMEHCDVPEDIFSFDFEQLKDKVYYRLVNRSRNEEALSDMPHFEIGDYAVICQCMLFREERPMGSIRIRREHLKEWGITEAKLFEYAGENTMRILPPTLRPMDQVLTDIWEELVSSRGEDSERIEEVREMLRRTEDGGHLPMYVLSNRYGSEGATSLLYKEYLSEFCDHVEQDFYILPSSVHEVILIPEQMAPNYGDMCEMVKEINETQVPEQEFLSDEVMRYSEFCQLIPPGLASHGVRMCGAC